MNEETTCNFIEDVVKQHISNEGIVYSHQKPTTAADKLFVALGGRQYSKGMSVGQAFALTVTAAGTAAMAFFAYNLKQEVDNAGTTTGLMKNEGGVSA